MTELRRLRARVVVAAVLVALVAGGTAASAGAATNPHPNGPPRVTTLTPRAIQLSPRVLELTPRVIDVAPKPAPGGTLTVTTDVLFGFDEATLSPSAQSILASVVDQVRAARPGPIVVTGYTDSIGDMAYNLGLSQRRAAAVQQFLAQQVSDPARPYQVVGQGDANPVAPNTNPDGSDNPAGRAQNRRVTIGLPS